MQLASIFISYGHLFVSHQTLHLVKYCVILTFAHIADCALVGWDISDLLQM